MKASFEKLFPAPAGVQTGDILLDNGNIESLYIEAITETFSEFGIFTQRHTGNFDLVMTIRVRGVTPETVNNLMADITKREAKP